MIRRQAITFPAAAISTTTYTLPKQPEAYRLFSVTVEHQLAAIGSSIDTLRVLDGESGILLEMRSAALVANNTNVIMWVAGVYDQTFIVDPAQLSQSHCLPQDLWIQPEWTVTITRGTTTSGDVYGPLRACLDIRETKGLAKGPPLREN